MTERFQIVKRNLATGGRVSKVHRNRYEADGCFGEYGYAKGLAERFNEREGRRHRNVQWTVRTIEARDG